MGKKNYTTKVTDFNSLEIAVQHLADRITSVEGQLQSLEAAHMKLEQAINEAHDLVVELQIQLARKDEITEKLEAQLTNLENTYQRLQHLVDKLRQFAWLATGIIATIQFLAPFLVQWVSK